MNSTMNTLQMEWTDTGCIAKATGFVGVLLTCPRCQTLLPRGEEHRCGDSIPPAVAKKKRASLFVDRKEVGRG